MPIVGDSQKKFVRQVPRKRCHPMDVCTPMPGAQLVLSGERKRRRKEKDRNWRGAKRERKGRQFLPF